MAIAIQRFSIAVYPLAHTSNKEQPKQMVDSGFIIMFRAPDESSPSEPPSDFISSSVSSNVDSYVGCFLSDIGIFDGGGVVFGTSSHSTQVGGEVGEDMTILMVFSPTSIKTSDLPPSSHSKHVGGAVGVGPGPPLLLPTARFASSSEMSSSVETGVRM